MELQSYINNISIFIGIVNIYLQGYKIIKCYNFLTSQFSKNHKNFKQGSGLHSQSTISPISFLIMSPSTNTRSRSSENIYPYTDATTDYSSWFDII